MLHAMRIGVGGDSIDRRCRASGLNVMSPVAGCLAGRMQWQAFRHSLRTAPTLITGLGCSLALQTQRQLRLRLPRCLRSLFHTSPQAAPSTRWLPTPVCMPSVAHPRPRTGSRPTLRLPALQFAPERYSQDAKQLMRLHTAAWQATTALVTLEPDALCRPPSTRQHSVPHTTDHCDGGG